MTFLYRLLGIAARSGERLSHLHVNFIPANLPIMFILGLFGFLGFGGALMSLANSGEPHHLTVRQAVEQEKSSFGYVTIKGRLIHEAAIEEKHTRRYRSREPEVSIEATYLPLIDADGKHAILVKRNGEDNANTNAEEVQITGSLMSLDSEVRERIKEMSQDFEGITFDTETMLDEGKLEGGPVLFLSLMLFCGIPFLLMSITFLTKYVVFRKETTLLPGSTTLTAPLPSEEIDLRVTGSFRLDEKTAKRFLNVPAVLSKLDTGEVALISHIDASSRFYGITVSKRQGYWAILMSPASLTNLVPGHLYDGFSERPAFRIRYADAYSGAPSEAILSFASTAEREATLRELGQLTGSSLSHI